jgi:hypothetical protein
MSMPSSDSDEGAGKTAIERCQSVSQRAMNCWGTELHASQRHDEGQPFQVTEDLDSPERSPEQLEWELTRWPEGAEL